MQPRWRNDRWLLAVVAAAIHAGREQGYPSRVARGEMTQPEADRAIRVAGAIAADWLAIAALEAAPDWTDNPAQGGAWPWERGEELAAASQRARAAADEDPNNFERVGFADAIDTLIWWETASPSARWLADTTIALRAQATAQTETFTLGVAA